MSATAPLGVGVIGTGTGVRMQIPGFSRHRDFEVVAVCSSRADRAQAVAEEFGIRHAVDSPESLAALPEVDLVSVATPPRRHAPGVRAALAHGKHVLCEKPFTLDMAEAEQLVVETEAAGVHGFMNFEFRHAPGLPRLAETIRGGRLGAIRYATVTDFTTLVTTQQGVLSRWWFDAEEGGGWLNAHGTHRLDQIRLLFGDVMSVDAVMRRDVPFPRRRSGATLESAVDDGYAALLQMASGATVMCFDAAAGPDDRPGRIEVVAESGRAVLEGTTLTVSSDGETSFDEAVVGDPYLAMFERSLDDVAAAIRGEAHAAPTFRDGLENLRMVGAVRRAALSGRREQLSSVDDHPAGDHSAGSLRGS